MQTAVNSHRLTAGLFRRQRRPAASRQLKQNDTPVLQEAGGGIRLEKRRCWSYAPVARLPQLTRPGLSLLETPVGLPTLSKRECIEVRTNRRLFAFLSWRCAVVGFRGHVAESISLAKAMAA